MGAFVRGIFIYERRAEFLSLFLWCGLIAVGMVGYAKLQGNPFAVFDSLMLFWGSMALTTWAGLKWRWPGARWLGVFSLICFACVSWFLDLMVGRFTFTTLFGFVVVGWAVQLARMDFAKEDLERELLGTHVVMASLLSGGIEPPAGLGEETVASALQYHLRKHDCAWEVCDQEPCPGARQLEGLLTKIQDPAFREEFMRLAHEHAHSEEAETSSEDASASG